MSGATVRATPQEVLISIISDIVAQDRHIAVGAASPIPGAAALLAQMEAAHRMQVTILHSQQHNHFTDGSRELFDAAAQGRIDTFFLGGVQIDGAANINLVGVGAYPRLKKRFPGSFGSALMYYVVPKVILFREEHSPRTLVEKVDFVSAPGVSDEHVPRQGGPYALLTNRALFHFDRAVQRFRLAQVHNGNSVETVEAETGFDFDCADEVIISPPPTPDRLAMLRQHIYPKVAEFYPEFAARMMAQVA